MKSINNDRRELRRRVAGALWWMVVLVVTGVAGGEGRLAGRVVDEAGRVVTGARVEVRGGGRVVWSGEVEAEGGSFVVSGLIAGRYEVRVERVGFGRLERVVEVREEAWEEVRFELRPERIAEEVVVMAATITGYGEESTRIPGSYQVMRREELERSRVLTINEALRKVAGVHARDEEGLGLRPNLGIRGVNPTRSSKVLLLEDGVPLAYAPYGDNASYYHPPVERFAEIEVLKGSGQVVHGPSTVGGVINYLTPNPPSKRGGTLTLLGGNRRIFNGGIGFGGSWGGTGLLLHYQRKQGDGAREKTRAGMDDVSVKVQQTLTERQALTLKANYYGEGSQVTYSGLRESEFRENPRGNAFGNDRFDGRRVGLAATHALVIRPDMALTTVLYGMHFDRDWWRQSSNSNQRPNDAADPRCGGMANLGTTCGNEGRLRSYENFGLESRLRTGFQALGLSGDLELGGRYHYEFQNRRQVNGETPTARTGLLVENNQRRNEAVAFFAQNRFRRGGFSVTPGLRVEQMSFMRRNWLANGGRGVAGEVRRTQAIPGIGFAYSPAGSLVIYGGVHRGFAPPRTEDIINNATGGAVDLDPELSWNQELGVRGDLGGSLRGEMTFFRMDYSNQVIPASLAGGVGATLTNGGRTLQQGVEVSGRVETARWLGASRNLFSTFAWTWMPTADFRGSRFSSVAGFGRVPVTGNRVPYAPRHLSSLTIGYAHPRGLTAQVEAVHIGDQFGDDLNTIVGTADGQRGLIPRNTIWNLTINRDLESLRSTVFVTVKNVFDRLTIVDRSRGILPGAPRMLQAGIVWRF